MKGGSLADKFDGGALGSTGALGKVCSCGGALGTISALSGGYPDCAGSADLGCEADCVVSWDVDCNVGDIGPLLFSVATVDAP